MFRKLKWQIPGEPLVDRRLRNTTVNAYDILDSSDVTKSSVARGEQ